MVADAEPAPVLTMSPTGTQPVSPATPVVVTAEHGRLTSVQVRDLASGAVVAGTLDSGGKVWTSTAPLKYAASYTVVANATNTEAKSTQNTFTIATLKPGKTSYPNMVPAPGSVDSVGVGQPIVFQFSEPVTDKAAVQQHLRVTSNPPQEGAWYWVDARNVHYRPKEFWQPGTTITVGADIYGVDFGAGVYGAENREVTYRVHDSWIAHADGNTQSMAIFHNGRQVKTMPISMGKDVTPTHHGIHVVSFKSANYTMDSCTYGVCKGDKGYYRTNEKWSTRISNDGEFVHENPNSVSAQGNSNVSHGCINLNAANAQWFFQNFGLGDVVDVVNSGGPALPVWDLYGDWSLSWAQWQAGNNP
nr:Ig-like domain-containing protein [Pseudonocardia spinosispora]